MELLEKFLNNMNLKLLQTAEFHKWTCSFIADITRKIKMQIIHFDQIKKFCEDILRMVIGHVLFNCSISITGKEGRPVQGKELRAID